MLYQTIVSYNNNTFYTLDKYFDRSSICINVISTLELEILSRCWIRDSWKKKSLLWLVMIYGHVWISSVYF